jgi:ferredoxin/flavodoxin---NADP+ reductase
MSDLGPVHPIAIVGAGPAGFFAAEALLKHPGIHVDLFERLPAPFGLVRYGVAPDHQKIKQVEAGFVKIGSDPRLRYFGNVELGQALSVADLLELYDQVVYAMGCQAARPLGVSGEHLPGVHSALEIVSWYNAHPDYLSAPIALDVRNVAVVGAGDVSMDLTRLLAASDEELSHTDMPPYALAEFAKKRIENIHLLIRRGPESASFALKELRGVLDREDIVVHCDAALLTEALTDESLHKDQRSKLEYLQARCQPRSSAEPSVDPSADISAAQLGRAQVHVWFHFLRSPVEFSGGARLQRVKVEVNRLERSPEAEPKAVGTSQFEELDVGLALFAVGYRGIEVPGVALDARSGLVPNVEGQLQGKDGNDFGARQYVVGWLKRGPQGVIGTNKGDARATVERMVANLPPPSRPLPPTTALLQQRGIRSISFADWLKLDRLERERGGAVNKPREKWLCIDDALEALSEAKL